MKRAELERVVKHVGFCTLNITTDTGEKYWTVKAISGHFDSGDSLSYLFSLIDTIFLLFGLPREGLATEDDPAAPAALVK